MELSLSKWPKIAHDASDHRFLEAIGYTRLCVQNYATQGVYKNKFIHHSHLSCPLVTTKRNYREFKKSHRKPLKT